MSLPEGLHFDRGTSEFRDAQEHVWITVHPAGMGDPESWRKEIITRIEYALSSWDEIEDACDECGGLIPVRADTIHHRRSCSLHPLNIIERR